MRGIKKILELRAQGKSQRFISNTLGISRNRISSIFKLADEKKIYWDQIHTLEEKDINELLFQNHPLNTVYVLPDFDYVHKELLKNGVTLKLLWEEYVLDCKNVHKPFYHQTQFNKLYRDHVKKNNLTMHVHQKPGDRMMVDWNGKTMTVTDRYTGEEATAYIFVATLPFSMYTYIEACLSMDSKNWIQCHVNAYRYFDGATRLLIPDNLKTGVISHKKYEDPVLNKSYQEMADYYGTSIIPARVRSPKDKAAVEGTVGVITSSVMAKLRNRTFFSIEELNKALHIELDTFNSNLFQKREGSRFSVYYEEEKDYMLEIPQKDFEFSEWKMATVQLNYHISVDKMNYSVPYEYVGKRVEVKMTRSLIEIFYKGTRISSHNRLYGKRNQYSTTEAHLPEDHRMFEWNGTRFKKWALNIGPETYRIIEGLLNRYKVEEQAYKSCRILKLSDKYTETRLENACRLASEHIPKPSYKNIKLILESGQDLKEQETIDSSEDDLKYACMRGKEYYGNNRK